MEFGVLWELSLVAKPIACQNNAGSVREDRDTLTHVALISSMLRFLDLHHGNGTRYFIIRIN